MTGLPWLTTDDQANAGYPKYYQPAANTAQYVKGYDLGTVLPSTTLSFVLQSNWLDGSGTITPTIRYRKLITDAWTVVSDSWSAVANDVRYFEIQINVTATGASNLLEFLRLTYQVATRELVENGTVNCLASDTLGTPFVLTKPFRDITNVAPNSPSVNVDIRASWDDTVFPCQVRLFAYLAGTLTRTNAPSGVTVYGVGDF
jgi:hypothetical protein